MVAVDRYDVVDISVQNIHQKMYHFSPFRYGGTQAATFCCLMTLWHQLHFEGGVDIYQLAKLAHYNRPGVFKHPEDVLFLYW